MDEEIRQPFEGWTLGEELGEGTGRYELIREREDGSEEHQEMLMYLLDSSTEEARAAAKQIAAELAEQQKLRGCEHIVSYKELKVEKNEEGEGGTICLRRERLTPLAQYCRENGVDETLVLRLGIDISKALMECDARGINHGNIRPRNIYITEEGFFKLGGFGSATPREVIDCGAEACAYMAPEVFHGQRWDNRADIYSLGMLLYWLLNRCRGAFLPQPPAKVTAEGVEQALRRRMGGEHIPMARFGGRVLQNAVLRACEFNPRERYSSAEQLMNALQRLPQRRSDPYAPPVEDEEPMPMPERDEMPDEPAGDYPQAEPAVPCEEPEATETAENAEEREEPIEEREADGDYPGEYEEPEDAEEYETEPEEEPVSRIPRLRTATELSRGPNSGGYDLSRSQPVWRAREVEPETDYETEPEEPQRFREAMRRNMAARAPEEARYAEDYYDEAYREYDDEPYEEYDELNEDYDGEYMPPEEPMPEDTKPGKLLIIGVIVAGAIFLASLGYLIYRLLR